TAHAGNWQGPKLQVSVTAAMIFAGVNWRAQPWSEQLSRHFRAEGRDLITYFLHPSQFGTAGKRRHTELCATSQSFNRPQLYNSVNAAFCHEYTAHHDKPFEWENAYVRSSRIRSHPTPQ